MPDRRGLTLATASAEARNACVPGTDKLLGVMPADMAHLQPARAADPGPARAHVARARA